MPASKNKGISFFRPLKTVRERHDVLLATAHEAQSAILRSNSVVHTPLYNGITDLIADLRSSREQLLRMIELEKELRRSSTVTPLEDKD